MRTHVLPRVRALLRGTSRGVLVTAVVMPLGAGLMFAVSIAAARVLPVEEFGKFNFVLQAATNLAILVSFGIPNAAQKLLPAFRERGERTGGGEFIGWSLAWLAGTSVCLLCAALFVGLGGWTVQDVRISTILFVSVPFLHWLSQRYLSLGSDSVALALLPRDVIFPVLLILWIVYARPAGAAELLLAFALLLTSCVLPAMALLLRSLRDIDRPRLPAARRATSWMRQSLPMLTTSLSQLGIHTSDLLILGALATLEDTAEYAACMRLALFAGLFVRMLTTALSHRLSALHARGDLESLQLLMNRCVKVSVIWAMMTIGFALLFGTSLLGLFGDEYRAATPLLLLLISGHAVAGALGPVSAVNNMIGNHDRVARCTVRWLLIAIALEVVAAATIGAIGVAAVAAATLVLMRFEQYRMFRETVARGTA